VKLLEELARGGNLAYIIFIVTHPGCDRFRPNGEIQPSMVDRLIAAKRAGVRLAGIKIVLTGKGKIFLAETNVPVSLDS